MPKKKAAASAAEQLPVPVELIERRIYLIRGHNVMLDSDLAELYQVETRALIQAVKRNRDRFPEDFTFQLTSEEAASLRSQFVISKPTGRGGRRYMPYVFTEHGALSLSFVLKSTRAIAMSIHIIRTFIKLREVLATHKDLARKIEQLDAAHKQHGFMLALVVKDIQNLGKHVAKEFTKLKAPHRRKPRIGFRAPVEP